MFTKEEWRQYEEARRLLKKHFGDPHKIASAYIAKLSSWPAVRPNDGTGPHMSNTLNQIPVHKT